MTVRELREKYLAFFKSKGHVQHPSGSLIPYDVTGRLDESLLFNGAGMVQFKPYFRGVAEPPSGRLTTAQKCIRTGDIEEVGDDSHLTFFEMLGNFSFGDYFKEEAIAMSWEFLTSSEWLGLDPKRLSFTVFLEDDEAFEIWSRHLKSAGLDPQNRIFRLDEKTNYWPAGAFSSGPPGPCGPNTEMFYWVEGEPPTGDYTREDWLRDDAEGRWLEVWNDVFIQYEWQGEQQDDGWTKTGMPELPFRSVDTGMGLERTAAVLAGHRSVYDTDAFTPIFEAIAGLDPARRDVRAERIIADHLRSACFCIADGIFPSNTGRGYVLRRLIRRAVLKGARTLGFDQVFLPKLVSSVTENLGQHYHELEDRREVIVATLTGEEEQFRRTLERGSKLMREKIDSVFLQAIEDIYSLVNFASDESGQLVSLPKPLFSQARRDGGGGFTYSRDGILASTSESPESLYLLKIAILSYAQDARNTLTSQSVIDEIEQAVRVLDVPFSGDFSFTLYDTFGFPVEITRELAAEAGIEVDMAGFKQAMAEAQSRSRAAGGMDAVYEGVDDAQLFGGKTVPPTEFVGYHESEAAVQVMACQPQVDAKGRPTGRWVTALDRSPFYAESGGQVADTGTIGDLRVLDVQKQDGVWLHIVEGHEPLIGPAAAKVDGHRRAAVTRNHTATHLLHAALRQVLGSHVSQAGSLVSDEILRFDFTHGHAMSADELAQVERIVNEQVWAAQPMQTYEDVPLEEARAMGAMALFGEKYAERVRVVQVGGMSPAEPSFSRELCGGIHVRSTGEIGLFKIISEASAASGIRRILALTGAHAYQWALDQERRIREAADRLKASPKDLVEAIDRLQEQLKEERAKREKLAMMGAGQSQDEQVGSILLRIEETEGADPKDCQRVADRLVEGKPHAVALVVNLDGEKLLFVCKAGDAAVADGAHAGNMVKAAAQAAGGGGGGRPNFATAGGRDVSRKADAIAAARAALAK